MAYIKEYWNDKEKRAEQAKKHTKEMEEKYSDLIEDSIRRTILYSKRCIAFPVERDMKIVVDDLDSVSAIKKYMNGKTAVLNFASYKEPGGMFINGSKAQEECLCHESFLYNVLSRCIPFYDWNNLHKNKALYLNRALYSPDIIFDHDGEFGCDVITCAAPNKSAAQKYQNVSDQENYDFLKGRIKFVLDVAADNKVDTLILGAYGCGVFGQDPYEVAGIFKKYLDTTHKCFAKVVFAIPSGRDGNLNVFRRVFEVQL